MYIDGGYYEGNWSNDLMDGYGKLYYKNGNIAYEGHWKENLFNGEGKVYNDIPDFSARDKPIDYLNFDTI